MSAQQVNVQPRARDKEVEAVGLEAFQQMREVKALGLPVEQRERDELHANIARWMSLKFKQIQYLSEMGGIDKLRGQQMLIAFADNLEQVVACQSWLNLKPHQIGFERGISHRLREQFKLPRRTNKILKKLEAAS